MIFLSLLFSGLLLWFGPWWLLIPFALVMGWRFPNLIDTGKLALGSALVWPAFAFIKDGQSSGLISMRMSGLFQLPHSSLLFAVLGLMGFLTVFLWAQVGRAIRYSV